MVHYLVGFPTSSVSPRLYQLVAIAGFFTPDVSLPASIFVSSTLLFGREIFFRLGCQHVALPRDEAPPNDSRIPSRISRQPFPLNWMRLPRPMLGFPDIFSSFLGGPMCRCLRFLYPQKSHLPSYRPLLGFDSPEDGFLPSVFRQFYSRFPPPSVLQVPLFVLPSP